MHVVFVHAYFYYSLFLYVNLDFHWAFLHFNLKSLVSICCGSSLLVVDCISVVRVKTSLIHPPLFKDLFAKHRILVRNFYQLFLFKIFSVFWSTWFMIRRPLFLDLFLCTVIFFFLPLAAFNHWVSSNLWCTLLWFLLCSSDRFFDLLESVGRLFSSK